MDQDVKQIASVLGLSESAVGQIITKYSTFSKKWSNVIDSAKKQSTANVEKKTSQPQPRKLVKKANK